MDVLGMRSSQINIPWLAWKSYVKVAMSSMEAVQRAAVPTQVEIPMAALVPTLQVEIPMVAVAASSLDLSVGEEGLQADLDTAVGADASRLDLKAARILSEVVAAVTPLVSQWQLQYLNSVALCIVEA
jgi:hypothetical protein